MKQRWRHLVDIPGVCAFLDAIKIQGSNDDEHLGRLHKILKRFHKVGLRIKKDKCNFFHDHDQSKSYSLRLLLNQDHRIIKQN